MYISSFLQVVDFIGTFAFAISGIRLASAKKFDVFGAYIVGVTTAIGGGTMRDLLLGAQPFWMTNPIYLICSGLALLYVIVFGKQIIRQNNTWFIFDTIGLALFTMTGVEKTLAYGFSWWVAIIMGAMTGAAGGVFRDVLINEVPLIFHKEIYALACILGGVMLIVCRHFGMDAALYGIICSITVVLIRFLSVRYNIQLPILNGDEKTK